MSFHPLIHTGATKENTETKKNPQRKCTLMYLTRKRLTEPEKQKPAFKSTN